MMSVFTKLIITVIVAISCFGFSTSLTHAANAYDEAVTRYSTSYEAYRTSLNSYTKARSEYVTYKTLLAQTQAMTATKDILIKRNDVLFSYINMLKVRLDVAKAYIPETQYQFLVINLDTINQWLEENQPEINSSENLEDLVKISTQIDTQIRNLSEIAYRAKAEITSSKVAEFMATGSELLGVTTEQVHRISRENKLDTHQLERWLLEADQKLKLAQGKYDEAQETISKVENQSQFNKFRTHIRSSLQYIQNANDQLAEIVKNIRVQ